MKLQFLLAGIVATASMAICSGPYKVERQSRTGQSRLPVPLERWEPGTFVVLMNE